MSIYRKTRAGHEDAQNVTLGYKVRYCLGLFAQKVTMGYCLCMYAHPQRPDWDLLFETASAQEGYFTTGQAAEAGYSTQLLFKHIRAGRVMRMRRGIYRLVHFPAGESEELIIAWLWSEQAGVISHQTALALHGLSDVLPANVHLTLPQAWRRRRFRVPAGIVLHHADVPLDERAWFGAAPITNPQRTLNDCAREAMAPDLLRQAARQAIRRGLVAKAELGDVDEALRPFGGLGA
jgi:predicted transcriptional regulator of viral defense system